MMFTHRFPGLGYTPLLSYLASLGLAKVVAEQADPGVVFGWRNGVFCLDSTVENLPEFVVDRYRPTPILSPWNGGSGFGEKDKTPRMFIDRLERSEGDRLRPFREAIAVVRRILAQPQAESWRKDKARLVQELRNRLPDESLGWLDASVVLTAEDPAYPPILGTGGNDGRLDFSTNFHQRLAEVLPELGASRDRSLMWINDLFNRTAAAKLVPAAVGQGDPLGSGGPGSSAFGSADSLVNPWEYILMLEGATLFAASTAKRFGGRGGRSAMPFTVASSPDGPIPGAAHEEARGELWAPVFESVSLPHFVQVLNEARSSWDGASAESVPAMYGAVHTYGVDRGITQFQRYGFLRRNGLAFVAAPLDTVRVAHRPEAAVAQSPLRRSRAFAQASGAATAQAHRRFQAKATAFLRTPSAEDAIQMLHAQTVLEATAMRSQSNRESLRRPGRLTPLHDVLPVLAPVLQGSPEARVAAGIASALGLRTERRPSALRPIRALLLGEDPGQEGEAVVAGFGQRHMVDVLADLMVWLAHHSSENPSVARGWIPWKRHTYPTPWEDIHAWAGGYLDDSLVNDRLVAFLSIDWTAEDGTDGLKSLKVVPVLQHLDPVLAVIQALASGQVHLPDAAGERSVRGLETSWTIQLQADQVAAVHQAATALIRRSHVATRKGETRVFLPRVGAAERFEAGRGPRILAALAAPLSVSALRRISPTAEIKPPFETASISSEGELS